MNRPMLRVIAVLSAVVVGVSSWNLHQAAVEERQLHADQLEISHICYGMFDPTQWKDALSTILVKKVEEFQLAGEDRAQVRKRLIDLMERLFDKASQVMERSSKEKGVGGAVKKSLLNFFVDMDALRAAIPQYADRILDYADEPRNREEMKAFVVMKIEEFTASTGGLIDRTALYEATERYGACDRAEAMAIIKARSDHSREQHHPWKVALWISMGMLLAATFLGIGDRAVLAVFVVAGLALLINGLFLPMIDIEARISEFEMLLLGEPITFTDQILFHQSKSVLEVVSIMVSDGDLALMAVGILVFAFSVALPTLKLLLTLISLARGRMLQGRIAHFLILKSGKWSMADVMVIAIFMAFIGFNGIVDSQLGNIAEYAQGVHILTLNNSSLELGFYLFTAYCIIGLITAALLPRALQADASTTINVPSWPTRRPSGASSAAAA